MRWIGYFLLSFLLNSLRKMSVSVCMQMFSFTPNLFPIEFAYSQENMRDQSGGMRASVELKFHRQ